jgi:hypothetical protein
MATTQQMTLINNLLVKMFFYTEIGDVNPGGGHKHTFDHITLLARGSLRLDTDAGQEIHIAPKLFVTKSGVQHKFTALEQNTVMCCVVPIRDGDGVDDVAHPEITEAQALELLKQFPISIRT